MKRASLLAFALACAAPFVSRAALARDAIVGPGSWVMVGADYGRRFTSGIPGPQSFEAGAPAPKLYDVHQDHVALSFRGTIWTATNVTVQGHRGGLHFNGVLGWVLKDNYPSVTGTPDNRPSFDDGAGGLIFGYKATYPWTIIETDSLRWGVGFGFGLLFEMGRSTPTGQKLDLDGCLGSVVDWRIGSMMLSGSYEYTPITMAAKYEHRARAFATFGPLGLGIETKLGRFSDTSKYFQGSLTLGYAWDLYSDD